MYSSDAGSGFNNRLATNICSVVIRVLEKLHIMKSDNQRMDRLNDAMEVYRRTATYLKKHVLVVVKVFVITILQRTAYFLQHILYTDRLV